MQATQHRHSMLSQGPSVNINSLNFFAACVWLASGIRVDISYIQGCCSAYACMLQYLTHPDVNVD